MLFDNIQISVCLALATRPLCFGSGFLGFCSSLFCLLVLSERLVCNLEPDPVLYFVPQVGYLLANTYEYRIRDRAMRDETDSLLQCNLAARSFYNEKKIGCKGWSTFVQASHRPGKCLTSFLFCGCNSAVTWLRLLCATYFYGVYTG